MSQELIYHNCQSYRKRGQWHSCGRASSQLRTSTIRCRLCWSFWSWDDWPFCTRPSPRSRRTSRCKNNDTVIAPRHSRRQNKLQKDLVYWHIALASLTSWKPGHQIRYGASTSLLSGELQWSNPWSLLPRALLQLVPLATWPMEQLEII